MRRPRGSATSSAVVIHGPHGQERVEALGARPLRLAAAGGRGRRRRRRPRSRRSSPSGAHDERRARPRSRAAWRGRRAARPGRRAGTLERRQLQEHDRLLGQLVAGLGGVRGVVEADAEDRPRARDGREQRDVGERVRRRRRRACGRRRRGGRARCRRRTRRPRRRGPRRRGLGCRPEARKVASFMARRSYSTDDSASSCRVLDDDGRRMDVERDPGCRGRDDRRRTARSPTRRAPCSTCSSATCPTPRCSSRTSTAASSSTGSSTRAAARRSGCAPTRRRRWATSFCSHMAEDRGAAPVRRRRRRTPSTRASAMQQRARRRLLPRRAARALRRHARRLARRALARRRRASRAADEQLFVDARPRARRPSSSARANDARPAAVQRHAARPGPRAWARSAAWRKALAGGDDARPPSASAACEVTGAPVAFLLEPSGREFVSTAMAGVEIAPVTIQPRGEPSTAGRAFTRARSYFVADARTHPALAAPLVEATGARSALFEPVLRDGAVAGVLIVIWRDAGRGAARRASAGVLRLLAAQAAVAIEHAALRARVGALALTDPLTGLATRRMWDEELPRELARARRSESPRLDRRARPRPPERVQHAARRARGRPPGQGVRRALARRAARGRLARPPRRRRVRRDPARLRARRGRRRARPRARGDPARADRLGRRRALGRRGAGRAAARPLRRTRSPPPSRPGAT